MGMELAAGAAGIMQYIYHSDLSLKINDGYYEYDKWCGYLVNLPSGKPLDNTCDIGNDYYYGYYYCELGELSLEPPRSLFTVVPTQLSGFV